MISIRLQKIFSSTCRIHYFFLAFIWCLALAAGTVFAQRTYVSVVSLMRVAPMCNVSIVSLGLITLFPLLISALAVVFSVPNLVYFVLFVDGFSLGYCLLGSLFAFGSAGWLIFILLSFSRVLLTVSRLMFFAGCVLDRKLNFLRLLKLAAAALIICIIDCFLVSRLLTNFVL